MIRFATFFLFAISLFFPNYSYSQQENKERQQIFLNIVTPRCRQLINQMASLEEGLTAVRNVPNASDAEILRSVEDLCKTASDVVSDSSLDRASVRESLAQFVNDRLLDSTLSYLEQAHTALTLTASSIVDIGPRFERYLKQPNNTDGVYLENAQKNRKTYGEVFLDRLIWFNENCDWLIAKYNLQYDKSYFDPVSIAKQKGKPFPHHRFKKYPKR